MTLAALAAAAGCGSSNPARDGGGGAEAGAAADGGVAAVACGDLPPLPWAFTKNPGAPASEDFTFDNDGFLVALSKNNLVRMSHGGAPQLLAANVAISGTGVRVLAGGDMVVADQVRGVVARIAPSGDRRNVGTNIRSPNGIQIGPAGKLYVTDMTGGNLYRVDPDTAETTLLSFVADDVDGLTFATDYRSLFVGSYGSGEIFRVPLAADGTAGKPELFVPGLAGADGITSDECGNLYVSGYRDGTLKRVSPDGTIALVAALPTTSVTAVNFGSGRQGWDARTIYVMDYVNGGIFEIPAGVRGAPAPPVTSP